MLALPYLIRRPQALPDGRPPLLILLHGIGGNEEGLFAHADKFDSRLVVISLRAPYESRPLQYRWFDVEFTAQGPAINPTQAEQSRSAVLQFINDAVMAFGCDPRQVYLMGFSQGATLAYSVVLTAPQKIRGAILIAGRTLPEITRLAAASEKFAHLTLLIHHGRNDPLIEFKHGLAARDLLIELGGAVGFREHAAGHEMTDEMLAEGIEFMSVQLGRTTPKPHLRLV